MNLALWERLVALLAREDFRDNDTLSDRIDRARDYVDNRLYRAEVVAELPADAPGGYLMVKANDVNLYVGAGLGRPLRKIPTLPL